jgi:hypothetical protein
MLAAHDRSAIITTDSPGVILRISSVRITLIRDHPDGQASSRTVRSVDDPRDGRKPRVQRAAQSPQPPRSASRGDDRDAPDGKAVERSPRPKHAHHAERLPTAWRAWCR